MQPHIGSIIFDCMQMPKRYYIYIYIYVIAEIFDHRGGRDRQSLKIRVERYLNVVRKLLPNDLQ